MQKGDLVAEFLEAKGKAGELPLFVAPRRRTGAGVRGVDEHVYLLVADGPESSAFSAPMSG